MVRDKLLRSHGGLVTDSGPGARDRDGGTSARSAGRLGRPSRDGSLSRHEVPAHRRRLEEDRSVLGKAILDPTMAD